MNSLYETVIYFGQLCTTRVNIPLPPVRVVWAVTLLRILTSLEGAGEEVLELSSSSISSIISPLISASRYSPTEDMNLPNPTG